ncbi:putative disease resistance protein RGA1 isoform X4 [Dendrobium catenatum]|uniref:putative disease resistance protein RGA1 isoform X4 n=1 Tax=Dendrobium catenatum TaxID=906689 RepID=UPI0009F2D311|nr:putative disease resistance protein RGA1 isoform X4 [Dendrobium catenatum]
MEGTISLIISNLLSSLERLSQFMPIFTSLAASSSSSSSSTVEEEMIIDVNSMQEGLMEDLSRLLRILQRIQALLHDAAKREVQDKQTKLWLSELRKVAYDAEDVLDQYDYQIIKTQVEGMTTTEEKPSLQRKKVDDDDDDFYGDQSKPYIESLKLVWANIKYDECARNDEAVLEGLEPHTNLKNLSIDGYSGNCFPNWFGNPYFYNLSNIRLTSFQIKEECKFLPLFKLPSLKSLKIEKNKEITKMGQDFWCYNAPSEGHENYSTEAHVDFHSSKNMKNKSFLEWKEHRMVKSGNFLSLKYLHIFYCKKLQQISTLPSTLEEFSVDHCERLEYIALPFSSRYLPRLQKVDIYLCHILKSVINLNNLLGTLKVLKLGNCYLLEPNPDEDYDLSYGRVSSEKGIGHVTECPGMREWCQRHGFTYQEDGSKLNLKQVLRLDLDEFPNKDSDNSYDKDCQELDSIKEAILNWSRQRKV